MKNISIKKLFPIIAIAGIIWMIIYVSSANKPTVQQQPISEPAHVPFEKYIGGSGITEPNTENISVGTNKAGIVKLVNFTVGENVSKDYLLFTIENSEAQAQYAKAEAQFKDAQDKFNIVASIADKRAVSKDERNQIENNLEMARANLQEAEANLELHNVRSPVDGVVLSSSVRVGEYAPSGNVSEPLVRVGNLNPMYVRVDIDENDAWRFNPNSKAIAYVRSNNDIKAELQFVRVEPYVRPKKSLTGESSERVDTRVLQVIYEFNPSGMPIYTGQQMDVYIEESTTQKQAEQPILQQPVAESEPEKSEPVKNASADEAEDPQLNMPVDFSAPVEVESNSPVKELSPEEQKSQSTTKDIVIEYEKNDEASENTGDSEAIPINRSPSLVTP